MTEPMYLISESQIKRFHLDSYIPPDELEITAAEELRARGPVAQQELQPSFDDIDKLNRKIEFYKKRADMLQCWQSSMRDPERKIVCDILANGFTLTTKEEVDNTAAQAREDVLPLLERLAEAFHTYEMDVADYDFPAPPKHRKLMDDLQKKIESLRPEVKK